MKYMFSIFGEEGGAEDMSPEDMKAEMERWWAFGQEAETKGVYVAGDALQNSDTATTVRFERGGQPALTDGPFAETKEQLGGFYLLDCKDLDEALEWARKIPLASGAVEVRPVADFSEYEQGAPAEQEAARQ